MGLPLRGVQPIKDVQRVPFNHGGQVRAANAGAHFVDRTVRPVAPDAQGPRRPVPPLGLCDLQAPALLPQRCPQGALKLPRRQPQSYKGSEQHVPSNPRSTVNISQHGFLTAISEAMTPALKPLSIFTTLTLAAQEFIIVSKGARPSKCAP
ncbi:MAG: hypothetical protein A2992_08040 [Elusimicrobia bacterium RIFCSPLOWO2_01_FULL_59_12]|nr:MAG: hypothetical protein A2992_08040 [Elusimicrobia bacterium RIFCSPLOWO2_01_FULL_59_12]